MDALGSKPKLGSGIELAPNFKLITVDNLA
jgi:hypothetical protein